jgi:hypothetical protein
MASTASGTKVTCVGFISRTKSMNDFSDFLLYYTLYKLLILDREHLDILYDAHQDGMNGFLLLQILNIGLPLIVNQVHSLRALRKVAILLIFTLCH